MRTLKERIKNFKMPHTYVILVTIMFIVLILTHIIPAGSYERVEDAVTGKMVAVWSVSGSGSWLCGRC